MRYAVAYVDELSGATLPYGWLRRDADFRSRVLSEPASQPAQTTHSVEPGAASAAQAPAALPCQWLRPQGQGLSAMTEDERRQQRWLDTVEGRGWNA
jgi:hypothetical protein